MWSAKGGPGKKSLSGGGPKLVSVDGPRVCPIVLKREESLFRVSLPSAAAIFLCAAMLYIAAFPGGWFQLGYTSIDFWVRAGRFWTNTHPPALCGKLGPENVVLQALVVGGREIGRAHV